MAGNKLHWQTDDNEFLDDSEFLIDNKQNGGKSEKKNSKNDHKKASSHNYEAEGANGDYTDDEDEEEFSFIINEDELKKTLKKEGKGKKKTGKDYSFKVGEDFSGEKMDGSECFELK